MAPPNVTAFRPDGKDAALFFGASRPVQPDWIDYNGHLNMAYYGVLFDKCIDDAFAVFGLGPAYVASHNASFFALEAHITYLGEIGTGDETVASFQILDYDAKRVHVFQELYRVGDGLLSATCEQMLMHVDMTTRRSAPFGDKEAAAIAAMAARQATLPRKPQIGRVIGIGGR